MSWLFAYGSLLPAGEARPCELTGWRRAWDVARQGSALQAARAGIAALHQGLDDGDLDVEDVRRLVRDLDDWQ